MSPAAAGSTLATSQVGIGRNCFRAASATDTTVAAMIAAILPEKTVFNHYPISEHRSDGDKRILQFSIRTAVHAYLLRQVFHLALQGYLELCTAYFIAQRRQNGGN